MPGKNGPLQKDCKIFSGTGPKMQVTNPKFNGTLSVSAYAFLATLIFHSCVSVSLRWIAWVVVFLCYSWQMLFLLCKLVRKSIWVAFSLGWVHFYTVLYTFVWNKPFHLTSVVNVNIWLKSFGDGHLNGTFKTNRICNLDNVCALWNHSEILQNSFQLQNHKSTVGSTQVS